MLKMLFVVVCIIKYKISILLRNCIKSKSHAYVPNAVKTDDFGYPAKK